MFTYNDEEAVNSLRNNYVSGFYTDFLPKEKIERDSEGKVIINNKDTAKEENKDVNKEENE